MNGAALAFAAQETARIAAALSDVLEEHLVDEDLVALCIRELRGNANPERVRQVIAWLTANAERLE